MTTPGGPATQTTANLAGGPYGAWSGTNSTGIIGPAGSLLPLGAFGAISAAGGQITSGTAVFGNANGVSFGLNGQTITATVVGGGVALYDGANSISTGTAQFSNLNGVTFGIVGQTITASVAAVGGAQTGISSIADANGTQTVGMLSFSNGGGVTFGLSTGAATATLTASVSQSVQTQASGAIAGSGFTTTTAAGLVIAGTNNSAGLKLGVPAYLTTYAAQTVQPALTAAADANGTQTTGMISFANSNGMTFGLSTGAATTLTASYTVPTVPALSLGVSTGGNTLGNTGIYSGQVVFAGGNNITLSVSSAAGQAQTITISGANAGGAQTGISGIVVSNTTYTSGTVSFSNANGISFGSSAGQAITASYTVPSTAGLLSAINVSGSNTSSNLSAVAFSNGNGVTFGLSTAAGLVGTITASVAAAGGAQTGISGIIVSNTTYTSGTVSFSNANGISFGSSAGQAITASYTVPSVAGLLSAINVSGSNTSSNLSAVAFSNGNGVSFGLSTAAGLVGTITASVAAAGGAQTGISGIIVSNTTYTSGTVSFSNANGISFGSSAGQAITASYTVPSTAGLISGMRLSAGGGTSNTAVTGLTFANSNNFTFGLSTGAGVGTITASYTVPAAQTGISAIQVANTTYTSGTVVWVNSNGISFGSSGANSITASYTVPTQTNQTVGLYAVGNTTQNSSTTLDARTLSFNATGPISMGYSNGSIVVSAATVGGQTSAGLYATGNTTNNSSSTLAMSSFLWNAQGAQTIGFSNGSIQLSVPVTSSLVGVGQISVSTNGSTISIYENPVSTYVPQWPASTSSLLINALGVSTANPVFFPFQVNEYLSFDMIAILQSYSYITSAVGGSNTQGVIFGLYSNNASTWSQISSGSSSIGMSNNVLSQTISYATATSTSGYGYNTTTFTGTGQAESFVGSFGFRNPIMQFAGNMTLTPGWYAVGVVSTASSAGANVGINQALIGNVLPISNMFGMGQSTTVTNQMLGMGYGTATTTGLPASMAFSNMTNSLGIIPIITIAST